MLDIIPVCMRDNRRPGRVFRNNNSHSSRKNNDDDHWNGDGNRKQHEQQQVCDAAEGSSTNWDLRAGFVDREGIYASKKKQRTCEKDVMFRHAW